MKAPKKLSAAIFLALNDLALTEQDPKYNVDMNWCYHDGGEKLCSVCFAGSVMAKTMNAPKGSRRDPESYTSDWERLFEALNEVRCGSVQDAVHKMTGVAYNELTGLEEDFKSQNLQYEHDPEGFKDAMCDLATMLESIDL